MEELAYRDRELNIRLKNLEPTSSPKRNFQNFGQNSLKFSKISVEVSEILIASVDFFVQEINLCVYKIPNINHILHLMLSNLEETIHGGQVRGEWPWGS